MGMTMQREDKMIALHHFKRRNSGELREATVSPRQIEKYGRWIPTRLAARFYLASDRGVQRITREAWAAAQPRRRRVRVA